MVFCDQSDDIVEVIWGILAEFAIKNKCCFPPEMIYIDTGCYIVRAPTVPALNIALALFFHPSSPSAEEASDASDESSEEEEDDAAAS